MLTTYIAIDVETTGLDPQRDQLLEVAALTFRADALLDEFHTLLNPSCDIPPEITRITGITPAMVADAPGVFQVRPRLRALLGDHVLVGHNVDFDLGFLNAERIGIGNHRLDTLTLATILVPEAGRYGLEALADHLRLPAPDGGQAHRARADAELTIELFLALRERALALSLAQLEEIVLAGRRIGWPETLFFEEALAERARTAFEDDARGRRGRLPKLFKPPKLNGRSLTPAETPTPLEPNLLAGMLRPGGNFSRAFPNFEHRPQQVEMLTAVAQAFNGGDHVLVEAGTGTGKSIGYLLPAAFWAAQNDRRVVISTNTINLQDQLIHKDIPEMRRLLPFELRAAVRKGRSNYLCTRLFQQMRHSGPSDADEMALFARILLWLPKTETGDVAELTLRTPGERSAWARLNGENAVCTADHCAGENCPLHLARQRAEQAHIVIINHALLLADVAAENLVLPEFKDLIIDEAHHLETAVTNGLSFRADKRYLESLLEELTRPRAGLLGDLQNRVRAALPPAPGAEFDRLAEQIRQTAQVAALALDEFFMTVDFFLQDHKNSRNQFAEQVRLTAGVRAQPGYAEVEVSWDNFNKTLKGLGKQIGQLGSALADIIIAYDLEDGEELRATLLSNGRALEETRLNLDGLVAAPQDGVIYWAEIFKERISLHAAPLHVGPLVEQHIFKAKETVILTSATLRTAGTRYQDGPSFAYIRDRLHAHDANELAVGSPFDYASSTLLYLVTDMPEPSQPGYQRYVEEAIVDVARGLGGRTMVLFTAYSQLRQTVQAIEGPLAAAGINLLAQLPGTSRQRLLEHFKDENTRTVLLGTRSFWEGVDVPGMALQALLIARLPFDVPSDPIFAARAETFENSFFEYSIPEAVLRFRQGFGRLIRRKTDAGMVAILDKRVLTKRYGQMFLDALPPCTVLRQRHGRLGELALRWLNREK
jgi:ATP-dependent DNA helicase DinG